MLTVARCPVSDGFLSWELYRNAEGGIRTFEMEEDWNEAGWTRE